MNNAAQRGSLRCWPPASRGRRLSPPCAARPTPLPARKSRPGRKSRVGASPKMAASTGATVPARGGFRGRMGRGKRGGGRGQRRGPEGGGEGALRRLKLAVQEFVRGTAEGGTPGGREGPRVAGRARSGGRKSRRELRREKRHLRKARRLQRGAGPAQDPRPGGEASDPRVGAAREEADRPSAGLRRPPAPPKAAPARTQAQGPPGRTKAPAAAAAARKRALLAANEEEDREIRKLERRLGLNKRRKKGDGSSSVPLSFARDGLDYVLEALGSGESSGLCESGSEAEEGAGPTPPGSELDTDAEDGWEEQDLERSSGQAAEDAWSEERDQDDAEEEARGALGTAKEEGGRKRVRFAEDEERSETPSEAVRTDDQVSCARSQSSGIFRGTRIAVRCGPGQVSTLAWGIPWTPGPSGPPSVGSQSQIRQGTQQVTEKGESISRALSVPGTWRPSPPAVLRLQT